MKFNLIFLRQLRNHQISQTEPRIWGGKGSINIFCEAKYNGQNFPLVASNYFVISLFYCFVI